MMSVVFVTRSWIVPKLQNAIIIFIVFVFASGFMSKTNVLCVMLIFYLRTDSLLH